MKQGMRAMAGAVALAGLLATAGPAMAKDRVIAVDGVSKTNADRRVEILVHVPDGPERERRGRARARGPGREEGAEAASRRSRTRYSFTGLHVGHAAGDAELQPGRLARAGARSPRSPTRYPDWSTRLGLRLPDPRSAATRAAARRWSASARAPRRTTASTTSAGRGCQNGTLGVTWSTSGTDEADMAINTRYTWTTGCTAPPGAFDLESVYLHENGHVAGLGHSTDIDAVMYPSYQTARCALAQDDKNGLAALY